MDLSPEQLACVEYRGPALMVVAAPGSGKTRMLTEAIRQRVTTGEVHGSQMLAVTFTRMAAQEMRERLNGLPVTVGTFHSICYDLICARWREFGGNDCWHIPFTSGDIAIFDRGAQRKLVKDVLQRSQRGRRVSQGQFIAALDARARGDTVQSGAMSRLIARYEFALSESNAVDYSTIPILGLRLVEHGHAPKWTDVFVDEAQDLDPLQHRFFDALKAERILYVGDPDQLIYGWRNASVGLMELRMRTRSVERRVLELNYRSATPIVKAADHLIAHNSERLRTDPMRHLERDGVVVEIQEQDFIEFIRAMKDERIGVLSRTHHILAGASYALHQAEIDHTLVGKRERVLDDSGVKLVIAYLVARDLPENTQMAEAVLLAEGYTTIEVEKMRADAAVSGEPLIEVALRRSDELFALYTEMDGESLLMRLTTVLLRVAERHPDAVSPAHGTALHELVSQFTRWERRSAMRTGGRFLAWLNLRDGQDEIDMDSRIQLMTMHAAKGLEFPTVFIVGLRADQMPHYRSQKEGTIEEERRLMYVAMTRAENQLVLVVPSDNESPFLSELRVPHEKYPVGTSIADMNMLSVMGNL
jgi:DNA helicase-2/ATP-dependent DNA helicase PcrA